MDNACGFCLKTRSPSNLAKSRRGPSICKECITAAFAVLRKLQATHECHGCGNIMFAYQIIEGPVQVHMCENCLIASAKQLRELTKGEGELGMDIQD